MLVISVNVQANEEIKEKYGQERIATALQLSNQVDALTLKLKQAENAILINQGKAIGVEEYTKRVKEKETAEKKKAEEAKAELAKENKELNEKIEGKVEEKTGE